MRDMIGMDAAAQNVLLRNAHAPYLAPMMDSAREAGALAMLERAQAAGAAAAYTNGVPAVSAA